MAKDQDNVHIYGGDDDAVWLAPVGSTLPTDLGTLDAAFVEVGWLDEAGIDFTRNADVQQFRAHQGGQVVKKKVVTSDKQIVFRAIEDNPLVESLSGDVESTSTVGDVTTTELSASSQVVSMAAVVDVYDTGFHRRHVIPRLDITVTGTESLSNSSLTVLECTGDIIGISTKITGPTA